MNQVMMNKEIKAALAWGGSVLVVALCIDGDTVDRVVFGTNGLMIAWYGNRIPKSIAPSAQARRAQRVAGWTCSERPYLRRAVGVRSGSAGDHRRNRRRIRLIRCDPKRKIAWFDPLQDNAGPSWHPE
jgi:hypothetical protein